MSAASSGPAMQAARRNLDAFLRALPARDWAAMAATLSPTVRRHGIEDSAERDAVEGRDAYLRWLAGFADPLHEYSWTIGRVLVDPEARSAVVVATTRYRAKPEDVPFGYRLAMIFGFDQAGLIDVVDLYWKTPAQRMSGDTIRPDRTAAGRPA